MSRRTKFTFFGLTLTAVSALFTAALLFACSPDPGPFFTPPETPENPTAFSQGRIGLLTPNLTKENELIAFRLLSGLKMDGTSGRIGSPKPSALVEPRDFHPTGQEAWLEKRHTVADPPPPAYIDVYRSSRSGNDFVYYENCLADAFETAASTLEDRRKRYGSAALLRDWVIAQDQVFNDCHSNQPTYPDALRTDAPMLARADREYQIAAAHFYAQDLSEAERLFRTIADDNQSPWQHIGSYLVGRTLLRQASLQNDAAALTEAREEFTKVANDKSAGSLADSARGLVEHLNAMEHADATLELLSKRLLTPEASPGSIEDSIEQSAFALRADSFRKALSRPDVAEAFDWVQTLEAGGEEHALERWHSRKSLPWLTLALMYANGKDAAASELIEEAGRVPDSSPGATTATYNALRLRLERGETNQVRERLNSLLAQSNGELPSVVNAWRAERMRVATSFDDLLRWAPRRPIDRLELGLREEDTKPILAYDSAYVLNYLTPVSKLKDAAHSKLLPAWSVANVALATWTRAFMLNDLDTAREVASVVAKSHADWAATLTPRTGPESDRWRFEAATLILSHHEFQPLVSVDYSKPASESSWWCTVTQPTADTPTEEEATWIAWRLPVIFSPSQDVLPQQDRKIAADEVRRLHDEGSAQSFAAPIIFDWAKRHPDDPLLPQALHRLVVVTRYGCRSGDKSNGRVSKAAFDLLHKKYPTSRWTAQTPYWFQ